jgi:hypothetical protein
LLQRWYDSDEEHGGKSFLEGTGIEEAVFRDSRIRGLFRQSVLVCMLILPEDLLSINPRPGKDDPIAMFVGKWIVPVYDRFVGYRLSAHRAKNLRAVENAREYEMKALKFLGDVICMIVSAVMPALAILILFNLKSTMARLVAVVLLSLGFAIVMAVVASRKADVFMATTAFAAVLVVFVGSTDDLGG